MNYWIFFFFEKNNNNKWCLRIKLSFCFWRVEYCGGNEWKREVEWSVQRVKGKRKEKTVLLRKTKTVVILSSDPNLG